MQTVNTWCVNVIYVGNTTVKIKRNYGYLCNSCGEIANRWEGRCPNCGDWNSLEENLSTKIKEHQNNIRIGDIIPPMPLNTLEIPKQHRVFTGNSELDRVLGGGIFPGSLILLGGEPGIGKSTLTLQLAGDLSSKGDDVIYCSGEESPEQLSLRANRLKISGNKISIVNETNVLNIIDTIDKHHPTLAIVDSVQTLWDEDVQGVAGSPGQVRNAVHQLMAFCKKTGITILLIGHVTKDGGIAGPMTLEHMVDVVLYMEGEKYGDYRIIRGIKNRFGPSNEIGLFTMSEEGLKIVDAPNRAFINNSSLLASGNVITVTLEGSRPLLLEVQALTAPSYYGIPRRTASGFDISRLNLLLAVLEKRANIVCGNYDVYLNIVGGIRVSDPSADLAVLIALASSLLDKPFAKDKVAIGEVGLGGEIRGASRLEARISEASKLGIREALIPRCENKRHIKGINLVEITNLKDALVYIERN